MPWTVASVHGNLQARKMEWVAIPFSRGSSQIRDEPMSPTLQADSLPSEPSITSILPTLLETWVSSIYTCLMASQMAQVVKNLPAMQETQEMWV